MNLKLIHLQYWRQKKAEPRWADALVTKERRISIDCVINANAGIKVRDYEIDAGNVLEILRLAGKRGKADLLEKLRRMSVSPGTVIRPERRASYCKKWLARIDPSL